MHNYFLGTAKKMFKLSVEKGILSSVKLDKVEKRLASINSLTDIGRIPAHISGNYGGFFLQTSEKTGQQFCSLYAINGILPEKDYKCWETFVLACRLLCKPFVYVIDVQKVDLLLLDFCKTFEKIYSLSIIT